MILVCLVRSSAELIGSSILAAVKKAAKFAVEDEIMIRVKNHHMPATIRVEIALEETVRYFVIIGSCFG